MSQHGKRYREARAAIDRERLYSPLEAIRLLKSFEATKFDETVEAHFHTGAATAERPRAQVQFQLGESVKVTSGPLSDFDGEIVDVNPDQQKLKVQVNIFERQVPVELSFDQVKKLD